MSGGPPEKKGPPSEHRQYHHHQITFLELSEAQEKKIFFSYIHYSTPRIHYVRERKRTCVHRVGWK